MYKRMIFLFLSFTATLFAAENISLKRYALIIGANNGGKERVTLSYAESDAKSFAGVMQEIGGVEKHNSILLLDPNTKNLRRSFEIVKDIIYKQNSKNIRTELIFYYSGHSDEEGLLIQEDRFSYKELRAALDKTEADVKIGILDSCSSGAFTKLKGGRHKSPFLVDESVTTRGHAYITSSSEDESAQESSLLKSSFFTHFLISALRGSADLTNDGKVTLHEAYSYARSETQARTEKTFAGPQHPSYDFKLSGAGDLVLTDLRNASSNIILNSDAFGRFFIRNEKGDLVSEINKKHGTPLTISVPPSMYTLVVQNNGTFKQQEIRVLNNESYEVKNYKFASFTPEKNVTRGKYKIDDIGLNVPETTALFAWDSVDKVRNIKSDFGLFSKGFKLDGYQFSLFNMVAESSHGAQFGGIANINGGSLSGIQSATLFNVSGGRVDNYGLQFAGLFNKIIGDSDAFTLQMSGLFNLSGQLSGMQFSSLLNHSRELKGLQIAGIYNSSAGGKGFQLGGLFNTTEEFKGVQLGGAFNTANSISGGQVSTLFNSAKNVYGTQIAGLYNHGKNVQGVQIALVNNADYVTGTQIGLININKDIKGLPVGLLNISTEGIADFNYYLDNGNGQQFVDFQFGSSMIYNVIYAGIPTDLDNMSTIQLAAGWGVHIPVWEFYIESDLAAKAFIEMSEESESIDINPAWRTKLALPIYKDLAIFAGFGLDFTDDGHGFYNDDSRKSFNGYTLHRYYFFGFRI